MAGGTVVHDVSLEIPPGEVTTLLGANGAGKSTLVLAVAGVLRPSGGHVLLGDQDLTNAAPERIRAAGVAVVPEGRRLLPALTVEDNLRVATYALSREQQARRDRLRARALPRAGEALDASGRAALGRRAADARARPGARLPAEHRCSSTSSRSASRPIVVKRLVPDDRVRRRVRRRRAPDRAVRPPRAVAGQDAPTCSRAAASAMRARPRSSRAVPTSSTPPTCPATRSSPAGTTRLGAVVRAAVTESRASMRIVDVPEPGEPGDGEVVVRPEAVGLCGSDFHYFLGHIGSVDDSQLYPRVSGHEAAGIVEAVGPDCPPHLRAGERVAMWPLVACGRCYPCRIGREQRVREHQSDRRSPGRGAPGAGFAFRHRRSFRSEIGTPRWQRSSSRCRSPFERSFAVVSPKGRRSSSSARARSGRR